MAWPLTSTAFLAALHAEGVRTVTRAGWQNHNRNHVGRWGPVEGVMLHHTAGRNSLSVVERGRSDLPGPLCIGLIDKAGVCHLVGYGRTNHAGSGAQNTYNCLVADRPPVAPPGPDVVDGNRVMYGFEIENMGNGHDPYPLAQLDAVERIATALCRAHGWSAGSVIGHKEWTRRKPDPSFSMPDMRSWVTRRLGKRPDGGGGVPVPPAPVPRPVGYEPFPGASFFRVGRSSPVITAMGKRLVAEGCGKYRVGPGPSWSSVDRASYKCFQEKLGLSGADADGIPGKWSWDRLKVPRVS